MRQLHPTVTVALLAVLLAPPTAGAVTPNEHLAPLAPFVGKTWRGEFVDSTPEDPRVDVQRWEWALNGQGIRIVHSLNDGEYGGETMVMYDRERERLIYFYFTTAGFYTTGTIVADDGMFVSHEEVVGSTEGVTAVRSTSRILDDGRLESHSEYLKNGEWVPGHGVVYEEDPTAEVVFPPVETGGD